MKWLKALGAAAAAVAVMLVVWLVVGNDVANRREMEVMQAWAEAPGSFPDFLARYPFEETSGAAHRLEAAADPLGLDLRPRARPWTGPEDDSSKKASQERQLINAYIDVELSKPSATPEPPSPEAAAVLDRMAPHLRAVEHALAAGEPRWRMEIARGFEARIPNVLGQFQLQRILLASALRATAKRDVAGAEALLEASWALNAPLRARPELTSQFISIAVGRMQAGVLRKVPVAPESWIERLSGFDPRQGMIDAFRGEAWGIGKLIRYAATDPYGEATSVVSRLTRVLRGPIDRIQAAQVQENWREIILAAMRSPVSDGDGKTAFPAAKPSWSVAGILAAVAMPNIADALKRANRLTVELELTQKALQVRAARGSSKRWPTPVPGVETSALRDARWIYTLTPDAHASIELSRCLDWGQTVGLVLPTRWTSAD
jgi:hypothetical protein